ncbi:MAG: hypothetical protein F6K31_17920 [Symploca sp. SIO2G7]|nr:hypothetical protein [Symploca sp. SIO2G7]
MEITKEKRKIMFLFLSSPSSPSFPSSPSSPSFPRSLDNDTFTLTCHQWGLGVAFG